jgi:excisionase family DNA binding protein
MPIEIKQAPSAPPRLLLSKAEAATAMGIGVRLLQDLMKSGEFPCTLRLGRRVLVSVESVRAWIAQKIKEAHHDERRNDRL